jgi:hypothetical protein
MAAQNSAKTKPAAVRAVVTGSAETEGKASVGRDESVDHNRLHRYHAPACLIWDRQVAARCDIIVALRTTRSAGTRQKVDAA